MSEPKRDRWKRYILTDPTTGEEHPWTRATTLAGALDDGFGLIDYQVRNTIIGLCMREDLLDLAYACDPEDREQLDEVAGKAMQASGAEARQHRGTSLHKFTARLDAGQLSRSPRQWQEHLDAYMAFKGSEGIETHPRFIERITVVPDIMTAGTMDRIVRHEGEAKIADLKTGNLKYDGMKIMCQLAIYAHGVGLWNQDKSEWEKMPVVSQKEGLVIHLPAESEKIEPALYRVDLEEGWRMAQTAYWIRELRKNKELLVKVERDHASSQG